MPHQKVQIEAADGEKFSGYLALPESGRGPGILLIQEVFGVNPHIRKVADLYAQAGYVVLAPDLFFRMWPDVELGYSGGDMEKALSYKQKFDEEQGILDLQAALAHLRALPHVQGGVAALGFCIGGRLAYRLATHAKLEAAVAYYGADTDKHLGEAASLSCPMIIHLAADDNLIPPASIEKIMATMAPRKNTRVFVYENAGHGFNCDARPAYNQRAALLAQSRTIQFLSSTIGPRIDVEELFDHFQFYSLNKKDIDNVMDCLTSDAVITYVPTLCGGHEAHEVKRFYQELFNALGGDARITTVSRTVSANKVIEELVLSFTHDRTMEFILPGVPPTNKKVEIPLVMLATFRLDKVARLNVYWDQASVLMQTGILHDVASPVSLHMPARGNEQASRILDDSVKVAKLNSGQL